MFHRANLFKSRRLFAPPGNPRADLPSAPPKRCQLIAPLPRSFPKLDIPFPAALPANTPARHNHCAVHSRAQIGLAPGVVTTTLLNPLGAALSSWRTTLIPVSLAASNHL